MQLANLDNEIFFKKVFIDPEVFRAFVRDVTGVDGIDAKIEIVIFKIIINAIR